VRGGGGKTDWEEGRNDGRQNERKEVMQTQVKNKGRANKSKEGRKERRERKKEECN
jgi:hypothetical protein